MRAENENLLQGDEIRALKAEVRSYQEELRSLDNKVQSQEKQALQEAPARNIGNEVRLRYLERHRQRMGQRMERRIAIDYERIKRGDRAAHRGRPVVDALLCLTGSFKDRGVYQDLYGVNPETIRQWKDVPQMIEISGFRASLQSEERLTSDFQVTFERLLEVAKTYSSPKDLGAGFEENKTLQQLLVGLQNCYDETVATNARVRQASSSQHNS